MRQAIFLPQPSEGAIHAVVSALERYGLCAERSFDLQQALGPRRDSSDVSDGSCQYVVLLAYGGGEGPVVITAYSNPQATYLRIQPGREGPPGRRLYTRVEAALGSLIWAGAVATSAA